MRKNSKLQQILPTSPQVPKKLKTLEEVEKDIENFKNDINRYQNTLAKTTAPMVEEFPFFSLPSTRRDLVNSALESLWTINKTSYETIAKALSTINNNTDSLNNLIRFLAVAEADLYTKLNRLSKVNKKESENVDKLSRDIKQTAGNTNKLSVIQKKMAILRKESLSNLQNRFNQIDGEVERLGKNKLDVQQFKKLQGQFEDSTQKFSKELTLLRENIRQNIEGLNSELAKKADANELSNYATLGTAKELEGKIEKSTQKFLDELIQLRATIEQNQIEVSGKMSKKADVEELITYAKANVVFTKEEVGKKLKNIWIAYGVTTATLLAGLIACFVL